MQDCCSKKKHGSSDKLDNIVNPRSVHLTPNAISKTNIEKYNCRCKGNCSSRICEEEELQLKSAM